MEPNVGMTRYSMRRFFEMILRRWYWLLIFAVVFAFAFSYFFWYRYYSTYSVSSTFIPASIETSQGIQSSSNGISIEIYRSLVKNDKILDAVTNSVDFKTTIGDMEKAISVDADETSVAVMVNVLWNNKDQAIEILEALKANLTFAVTHSTKAGAIKWMDAVSSQSVQPLSSMTQPYQIFIIGALVGLLVGMVFSLFLGLIDKRVLSLDAVRYGGDVSVIGTVEKTEELSPEHSHSKKPKYIGAPNKQIVAISLFLKKHMEAQNKKIVMCTAPSGKCGTSTLTQSIAKVLSGIETNILIVTIIRNTTSRHNEPKIIRKFPGVYEFVLYWNDSESDKAFIDSVSALLPLADKKFKLILVDSPAVLENIQISMLVEKVDATLLVCRYGKTKYDEVQTAVSLLSRAGAKPVYCVWNFADKHYNKSYFPIEYHS